MSCEKENQTKYGRPDEMLCSTADMVAYLNVGAEMKIGVRVLARAGEQYIEASSGYHQDPYGMPLGETADSCINIVPDGKIYLEITNETDRMGEFYRKVCKILLRRPYIQPGSSSKQLVRIMSSDR
jgi:hypothetical protein